MRVHLPLLTLLTCHLLLPGTSQSQALKAPLTPHESMVSLNLTNEGQHLHARVGVAADAL